MPRLDMTREPAWHDMPGGRNPSQSSMLIVKSLIKRKNFSVSTAALIRVSQ
jgi:hypothetical protein